jgi:hypothetical protein
MSAALSGVQRVESMSSRRSAMCAPRERVSSQHKSAASNVPGWAGPDVVGANRQIPFAAENSSAFKEVRSVDQDSPARE